MIQNFFLDLHKLDEWTTIIPDTEAVKEWVASESESDEDDEDIEDDEEEEDDDDNESDGEPMETD